MGGIIMMLDLQMIKDVIKHAIHFFWLKES